MYLFGQAGSEREMFTKRIEKQEDSVKEKIDFVGNKQTSNSHKHTKESHWKTCYLNITFPSLE